MSTQAQTSPVEMSPSAARATEVQGVVDNIAAGRIFGWAWNPAQPTERLAIALRLGQQTMAETVASRERADLKGAGVGDGCHAFDLQLTPELIERRAEIFIVARTAEGLEVPLPILGARRALSVVPGEPGPQAPSVSQSLSRAVKSLAAAQQDLSQRLNTLADRLPETAATPGELEARLATLELWCLRLDERLAGLPSDAPRAVPGRRLDAWQIVLGGIAGIGVAGAVVLAWIGAFPALGGP